MAIKPLPENYEPPEKYYQVRLEPRLDLSSLRRRSSRPRGIFVRALAVAALVAGLMAVVSTGGVRPGQTTIAAPAPPPVAPSIVATESAAPTLASEQPERQARAIPLSGVDYTPVASIPRAPAPQAPAPPAATAFAPVERAPGFTGFTVTAGE
jgi:hypothetical protein